MRMEVGQRGSLPITSIAHTRLDLRAIDMRLESLAWSSHGPSLCGWRQHCPSELLGTHLMNTYLTISIQFMVDRIAEKVQSDSVWLKYPEETAHDLWSN